MSLRGRLYPLLADGGHGPGHGLVAAAIVAAILASVLSVLIGTLPDSSDGAQSFVRWAGLAAILVFSAEFLARLWVTPEGDADIAAGGAWRARQAYLRSPYGVIDLLVVLPAWVGLVAPLDPGFASLAGVLVLFKLARYLPALPLVGAVVAREGRSLMAALTAMMVLLVIVSTVMFLLERSVQPEIFKSIPHTMWWGIVTMATVGYGDMAPVTALGRVFGGFTMLLGIAMFAVPAGILATGFAEELKKRDFVVTWRTVARVPLFASLDASRIATIAGLLKPQIVPPNSVVVRRDDQAEAMFFIMEGEVEVDVQPHPVRLKQGDFFGEVALLHNLRRTATVTAVRECRLLSLDVADFRRLTEQHPDIRTEVERIAAERAT
jgi:voltage-gated potassium channel